MKKFEIKDRVYHQDYGYCIVVSASSTKYMIRPEERRWEIHVVSASEMTLAK